MTLIPGAGTPLHSHSAVWFSSAAREPLAVTLMVEAPVSRQLEEVKLW